MATNPWGNWGTPPAGAGGNIGGQNQWMSYPSLPNFGGPTSVGGAGGPTSFGGGGSSGFGAASPFGPQSYAPATGSGLPGTPQQKAGQFFVGPGGRNDLGGNTFSTPTFDPYFTSTYFNMLQGLLGQSGGLQNNLLSFLGGGPSTIPGAQQLSGMAQTGNPISALPEWQKMVDAQQRNIKENQANLQERFAFAGDLQSSPFGTAMTDYMTQTTKDQNALLAQLEQQAMESAMGRELQAGMGLQSEAGAESQFLQQLLASGAMGQPGVFQKSKTSGLGGLLGGIGSMLGGLGSFGTAAQGAGGIGALLGAMI